MTNVVRVKRIITIHQTYQLPIEGENSAYGNLMTQEGIRDLEAKFTFGDLIEQGAFVNYDYNDKRNSIGNTQVDIATEVDFFDDETDKPDPDAERDLVIAEAHDYVGYRDGDEDD